MCLKTMGRHFCKADLLSRELFCMLSPETLLITAWNLWVSKYQLDHPEAH